MLMMLLTSNSVLVMLLTSNSVVVMCNNSGGSDGGVGEQVGVKGIELLLQMSRICKTTNKPLLKKASKQYKYIYTH